MLTTEVIAKVDKLIQKLQEVNERIKKCNIDCIESVDIYKINKNIHDISVLITQLLNKFSPL